MKIAPANCRSFIRQKDLSRASSAKKRCFNPKNPQGNELICRQEKPGKHLTQSDMLSNKFTQSFLVIAICTGWFVSWTLYVIDRGMIVEPHRGYVIFGRPSITTPDRLASDTLIYNDALELTQGPDPAKTAINRQYRFFFNKNPYTLMYLFFMATLSSISFAVIFPLFNKVFRAAKECGNSLTNATIIVGSIVFALVLFMIDQKNAHTYDPIGMMAHFSIMLRSPWRTSMLLQLPVLLAGILCIIGLLLSAWNIEHLPRTTTAGTIADYRRLRNEISQILLILGILVASGSVITTSALRQAINGMFISRDNFELFPREIVYIYALLYTIFIVLVYVPVYYILVNKGKEILDNLNPISMNGLPVWNTNRAILDDYLGLKTTLKENLSSALVVISPLLSGILSQLIAK